MRDRSARRRRFIPAFAGNTASPSVWRARWSVHPRVCGEHERRAVIRAYLDGSSPRLRGTPAWRRAHRSGSRFIPAFAGNTPGCRGCRRWPPVHPRVCGEHVVAVLPSAPHFGSSPRLRGTLAGELPAAVRRRFIPAFAGNTWRRSARPACRAVHPRVCGEHYRNLKESPSHVGSSPRLRGTRARDLVFGVEYRFIPAFAGNTCRGRFRRRGSPVHPRVCGEHPGVRKPFRTGAGSSPRLRGTRRRKIRKPAQRRFIPAFAGNTR